MAKSSLPDVEKGIHQLLQTHQSSLEAALLHYIKGLSAPCLARIAEDILSKEVINGSIKRFARNSSTSNRKIAGVVISDTLNLNILYYQVILKSSGLLCFHSLTSFLFSMRQYHLGPAALITNSQLSPNAEKYLRDLNEEIRVINGPSLVQFMIKFNIGLLEEGPFRLKKIDPAYFSENLYTQ